MDIKNKMIMYGLGVSYSETLTWSQYVLYYGNMYCSGKRSHHWKSQYEI